MNENPTPAHSVSTNSVESRLLYTLKCSDLENQKMLTSKSSKDITLPCPMKPSRLLLPSRYIPQLGATNYQAMKAFENHQRAEGESVSHGTAKELLAGFAVMI